MIENNDLEVQILEESIACGECYRKLDELNKSKKYALVGTIGSAALITLSIPLTNGIDYALALTGTVVFPSFFTYLTDVKNQIDQTTLEKDAHAMKIKEYQKKQASI